MINPHYVFHLVGNWEIAFIFPLISIGVNFWSENFRCFNIWICATLGSFSAFEKQDWSDDSYLGLPGEVQIRAVCWSEGLVCILPLPELSFLGKVWFDFPPQVCEVISIIKGWLALLSNCSKILAFAQRQLSLDIFSKQSAHPFY